MFIPKETLWFWWFRTIRKTVKWKWGKRGWHSHNKQMERMHCIFYWLSYSRSLIIVNDPNLKLFVSVFVTYSPCSHFYSYEYTKANHNFKRLAIYHLNHKRFLSNIDEFQFRPKIKMERNIFHKFQIEGWLYFDLKRLT